MVFCLIWNGPMIPNSFDARSKCVYTNHRRSESTGEVGYETG